MAARFFGRLFVTLVPVMGCASASAGGQDASPSSSPSLCEQSLGWKNDAASPVSQVVPQVSEGDSGRSYHFDLGGRGGVSSLDASCGWGSYAECDIKVLQADGATYQFSELSTFGLWESRGSLYLLYRIVVPKDDAAASKRRVVKVSNPPLEVCNEIGDYSNIM